MSASFRRGGSGSRGRNHLAASHKMSGIPSHSSSSATTSTQTSTQTVTTPILVERKGTKPWVGGVTLTSSGLRELDAILGGGQPLGTAVMIEEDRFTQDLALALVRYWAAEGVAQEQSLSLIATCADVHAHHVLDQLDHGASCTDVHWNMDIGSGMSPASLKHFLTMLPRDQHLDKARAKSQATADKIEQIHMDLQNRHTSASGMTGSGLSSHVHVSSLQGFGTIQEDEDEDEDEDDFEEEERPHARNASAGQGEGNGFDADAEEGLKNAWQYKLSVQRERFGAPLSSDTFTKSGNLSNSSSSTHSRIQQYCHSYDLSGKMMDQYNSDEWNKIVSDRISIVETHTPTTPAHFGAALTSSPSSSLFKSQAMATCHQLMQHIQSITSSQPNTVIRMLLMNIPVQTYSIILPLLLTYIRQQHLPVVLLTTVRPWLRRPLAQSPHPQGAIHKTYTQALTSLKRTHDAVFTCEGFAANLHPPPSEFSDLAGILSIRKVALQSSVMNHFSDTTTNRRPPANRYGMKRDRRKMHVRMLHLPPEDFSVGGSSVSGSGVRTGAGAGAGNVAGGDDGGKGNKGNVRSSSKTALQPGMGCASHKVGGSSSSLEF